MHPCGCTVRDYQGIAFVPMISGVWINIVGLSWIDDDNIETTICFSCNAIFA